MASKDLHSKLNTDHGDSSGFDTRRVMESAANSMKELYLKSFETNNGCGEYSPKQASWMPTKVNNNTVVLHRPIRHASQPHPSEKLVSSVKSADTIMEKDSYKSNRLIGPKSASYCDLPKSETDRPRISRKYCKIESPYESDGESNRTVRDEFLTLERNGFYESNGSLTLSLVSPSSSSVTQDDQEGHEAARREAFNSWLARKEEERKESAKKQNRKNAKDVRLTSEEQEILFKKWLEKKKSMKDAEKSRQLMKKQREEDEKKELLKGKEDKLKEWIERKENMKRELHRREKEKADAVARAKNQRRKMGEEAYHLWLKQAKNRPLPVPLNKGELSMRGSISTMYVNPLPWKCPEERDENSSTSS